MTSKLIAIIGASGFVGRYTVSALAKRGHRIRACMRKPHLAPFLKPMGDVGQIALMQTNIRDETSVAAAVQDADAVINLVGILAESGSQRFMALQADGAAMVAEQAAQAGIKQLIHVSAIGADAGSGAAYARTKADGENRVSAAFPEATVIRPSIVFGPEDQFFNRFAIMAQISPLMPLICGHTRFQPVYVGDLAAAIASLIDRDEEAAALYELGGPQTYSFRELLDFIMEQIRVDRPYLPIPTWAAKLQGTLLSVLPNPPLTRGQVIMLERDNIVSGNYPGLEELGIAPTAIETTVPSYLVAYRRNGQFARPGS